ncbi:photosystem II reaction center PsbP [Gloeobacter kilaueensis]|uniref:Photosystem II oxygen evolving complex protein PsbP n=1 Tax=Gloeobacter kilaueensis (strain ATCC BAA-2537 / CCAP 1431/1 / ULC 316 / JS1) TaxID=1183438 RepID=U5QS19_GLOK1|nr:photosystem II reaction center PsbP [Gloeobacter kilaueensis]AGY60419.1 photosystem II oxygen evolving complex protein PsbP [Gloeobacter kilaueensis JS1]
MIFATGGRRLVSSGIAALLVLGLFACSRSGINAPPGFQRFQEPNSAFTLVYPDTWTFQNDPGGAVRLSDPADATYQVSVVVSPAPRKDIKDITAFGSPKAVAERFATQVLKKKAPPGAKIEIANPQERKDSKGIPYYSFEVVLASGGKAIHYVYCVSVNGGKVYTLATGSNAIAWLDRREKLYQIVNSFTIN